MAIFFMFGHVYERIGKGNKCGKNKKSCHSYREIGRKDKIDVFSSGRT